MKELHKLLFEFLSAISEEVSSRIPSVSGKTRASFEVNIEDMPEADGVKGELLAAHYIFTFQDGRPPTSPNAPRGNPTLQQAILAWLTAKGITGWMKKIVKKGKIKTAIMSQESMSWAIAIKIHREGNRLFRKLRGASLDIISKSVNDARLDAFVQTFGEKAGRLQLNEVFKNQRIK